MVSNSERLISLLCLISHSIFMQRAILKKFTLNRRFCIHCKTTCSFFTLLLSERLLHYHNHRTSVDWTSLYSVSSRSILFFPLYFAIWFHAFIIRLSDDFFCDPAGHLFSKMWPTGSHFTDELLLDCLEHSSSTANSEFHRLLLDCNETEQAVIIRVAKELKATLVSLGI